MTTKAKRKTILESARFFIIIILITVSNSISYSQSKTNDNTEHIIQGIPCKGEVKYFDNNKLNTCYLAKDFTIEGYLLPEVSKIFLSNIGKLDRSIISKETKFFGQALPAKTNVFFDFWGEKVSFWLPINTMIQGYLIGAMDDGPGIPLYQNGKLKEIWLLNDEVIDGVPCTTSGNVFKYGWHVVSLGTDRRVRFYDNGHIQRALLSKDIVVQGHSYKKGELIFFDKGGKIDLSDKKAR